MAMYQEGPTRNLAPTPTFPERDRRAVNYEAKYASNSQRRGPLRFEEGIATDTAVPGDFQVGVMQGYRTAPGRPNHNLNVYEKPAAETMRERAHLGSAAWLDSKDMQSEFMHGVNVDANSAKRYEQTNNPGTRQMRMSAAVITD